MQEFRLKRLALCFRENNNRFSVQGAVISLVLKLQIRLKLKLLRLNLYS